MEEQESATADAPHMTAAAAATAALSSEAMTARGGEMGIAATTVIQGRKCYEYLLCVRAVARFRGTTFRMN